MDFSIIDCDVHQTYSHQEELYPFLNEPYLSRVREKGLGYPPSPYTSALYYKRPDAKPANGTAGSDQDFLKKQLFDEMGVSCCILNGQGLLALPYIPETDYPAALANAYAQWLIKEWLEKDHRFYGSLHIPLQNPVEAAKIIREYGAHEKIVQVIIPCQTELPISHPFYQPIIEAICDMQLVLAFHIWQPSIMTHASTPIGNPPSYVEYRIQAGLPHISQMVTLVMSGMFEKYRDLKVAMIEGGYSWVVYFLWRMDQIFKSFRREVPWLKRMPSEYLLEHVRFGTQPIEEPFEQAYSAQIMEMIHASNCLVYCSDYPHWDADNPSHTRKFIKPDLRRKVFYENAKELYGLEI